MISAPPLCHICVPLCHICVGGNLVTQRHRLDPRFHGDDHTQHGDDHTDSIPMAPLSLITPYTPKPSQSQAASPTKGAKVCLILP
jgi:hypothetical protein